MSTKLKPYADLKVKVREYEDKETGKTKGVYVKVGTLFASPHFSHMFISMEAIPVKAEWDGAVSVFPREDAEQGKEDAEKTNETEENSFI
jgi:hypothetical protein